MQPEMSRHLCEKFINFLEMVPPGQFSRNLRKMLFQYLYNGYKAGVPLYHDDLIWGLEALFDLLDEAERKIAP
jgi:hypothetical protein